QIPHTQFRREAELDARDRTGDLAGHKLKSPSWTFMIEKNAAQAIHAESLAIIAGQFESGNLANPIGRSWMKWSALTLRGLTNLSEHFGRASEIKTALRLQLFQCRQHVMRSVNVNVQRREAILKALGNEALRGQVITFRELVATNNAEYAGITFETACVKLNSIEHMGDSGKAALGVFERHPAYNAVDLIAQRQQVLDQVTAVL